MILYLLLLAQIPPAQPLAPEDVAPFQAEIRRLEELRKTAGDPCTVDYALARTWAAGKQYPQAMAALQHVANLGVGLNPVNDSIFEPLRGSREFQGLLTSIRNAYPPIGRSSVHLSIDQPGFKTEGIAYDRSGRRFLAGGPGKIVQCTNGCRDFVSASGLDDVLGLKADPRDGSVWAASNSAAEAGLFHFRADGVLIRKYALPRKPAPHLFNDLAIDDQGRVFVTDTAAGTVYTISNDALAPLRPGLRVEAANGIAAHGGLLYVAGFPDGLTIVDIASGRGRPLPHPRELCMATTDGFVFHRGSLYAIQNGVMTPRLVRLRLSRSLDAIVGFEVLERFAPTSDGPTTAAISGRWIYFFGNTETSPVRVLKTRIPR